MYAKHTYAAVYLATELTKKAAWVSPRFWIKSYRKPLIIVGSSVREGATERKPLEHILKHKLEHKPIGTDTNATVTIEGSQSNALALKQLECRESGESDVHRALQITDSHYRYKYVRVRQWQQG